MGKSTISMAIFYSYVKLPEGKFNVDELLWIVHCLAAGLRWTGIITALVGESCAEGE